MAGCNHCSREGKLRYDPGVDFALTQTQKTLQSHVLSFAKRELNSDVLSRDRAHEFGRKEWQLCGELGLPGLSIPEAYGGLGLDHLTTAVVLESLAQGCEDTGLVFSLASHLFAGALPIAAWAKEELRQKFLPSMANGSCIGANAITESEAGSDVFSLKCRVRREGDSYVLYGEKTYVTNGPIADVFVVFATTDPRRGFMGVSAFIVERDSPGLRLGEPFDKIGLRTSPTSSLYLDECRIPVDYRLGAEGQGHTIFKQSMLWERSCEFAVYTGAMQRQLERVVEFAKTRSQANKAIGKNQAISHKIVNMSIRLDAARMLLHRACWMLDQNLNADKEVSMAKIAISEAAIESSLDAIQIHGGNGVMTEYQIERFLRDAIPSTITSGTSEIQRNIISQCLGL